MIKIGGGWSRRNDNQHKWAITWYNENIFEGANIDKVNI